MITKLTDLTDRALLRGPAQLSFLVKHGLLPHHSLLEIGCNYLNCSYSFIQYLDVDKYIGIDKVNQKIKFCHQYSRKHQCLKTKNPQFYHICEPQDLILDYIDITIGFSIFIHNPIEVLQAWINFLKNKTKVFFMNMNIVKYKSGSNDKNSIFWLTDTDFINNIKDLCNYEELNPFDGSRIDLPWNEDILTQKVYKITW